VYAWLWNRLPGPFYVRFAVAVVLFILVVALLFLWVFPWLEPRLPFTDVTVDQSATAAVARTLGL
jgi:hypothetical protein